MDTRSSIPIPSGAASAGFGGVLQAQSELAVNRMHSAFIVDGANKISRLTALPKGQVVTLYCTGAPPFVHSASLQMPGNRSFGTLAGDSFRFLSLGNGAWKCIGAPTPSGEIFYYVRPDGNDANTGLANTAADAFATPQRAWDTIAQRNIAGGLSRIIIADGTYGAVTDAFKPLVGGRVLIQGNVTTPANVSLAASADDAIEMSGSTVVLSGLKLSNTNGSCIHAYRTGVVIFEDCEFGSSNESHIFCDNQGQVIGSGAYRISGDAPSHWVAHTGGLITIGGRAITLIGTRNFSSVFAYALRGGIIEAAANTYTGTATGKRFEVDNNASIYTGNASLTEFPGNAAGTIASGNYNEIGPETTGTWTPTYRGATTAGVTTHSAQNGTWYRIGRLVYIEGRVTWSAASGTGQAQITGLPFTPNGTVPIQLYYDGVTFGAGKQGNGTIVGTNIALYALDTNNGAAASAGVEAAGDIYFAGVYLSLT